jgi:hypothetical protein
MANMAAAKITIPECEWLPNHVLFFVSICLCINDMDTKICCFQLIEFAFLGKLFANPAISSPELIILY